MNLKNQRPELKGAVEPVKKTLNIMKFSPSKSLYNDVI
jgi:hypothetical protein